MARGTFNIDGASYDNKSYSTDSQTNFSVDTIQFKSDGTKMYVSAASSIIYQYSLSTAWDVSTASYDNKSYNHGKNEGIFKPDGTKIYFNLYSGSTQKAYQYSLSTAWDVSTASYDNKSYQVNFPYTLIAFSSDGTKAYFRSVNDDLIKQYSLSTAWDISTASDASKSLSTTSQDGTPISAVFNDSGTKLFMSGYDNSRVYQYSLSTARDISTASYDSKSYNFSIANHGGMTFKQDDGAKFYVIKNDGLDSYIQQYTSYTPVTGPAHIKTINGVAIANVKTINGVAIANVKSWNGIT